MQLMAIDIETTTKGAEVSDPYLDDILLISVVTDNSNEYLFENGDCPQRILDALVVERTLNLCTSQLISLRYLAK